MTAIEILRFSGELRKGNPDYLCNAFFTLSQLEDFLQHDNTSVLFDPNMVLLLEDDPDMLRLYVYARNAFALQQMVSLLPKTDKPLIADIIGKEAAAQKIAQQFCKAGFSQYSTFVRMVCSQPILPRCEGADCILKALPEDVDTIYAMLRNEFDPLVAHIPKPQELQAAIEKREINVFRVDGTIAGLAYFETISEKYSVLRYFVVRSEYRGRNIGGALLYNTFARSDRTIYMLWVGTDNKTQTLYQRINFNCDGLTNYILKFGG